MRSFEKLPKDVLYTIAMEMDCIEVVALCQTNSRIREKICNNIHYVRNKLYQGYGFKFKNNDPQLGMKYLTFLCKTKNKLIDKRMYLAAKEGWKLLVDFFIEKGANEWDWGMQGAAEGGHKLLVDYFIEKGANEWDVGMQYAAKGGHKDLVDFFIEKGANYWSWSMYHAARGGHKDLVDFFIEKGADDWNSGMFNAALGGHKLLVDFFIEKGADDWNSGMVGAAEHKDLVNFFKSKLNN